ncbi:MAG: endonuclease III [Candidatus Micrarchaeota archaeon]
MEGKILRAKIIRINRLLDKEYGSEKPWKLPSIDALVNVILSQNTNDVNSGKAFRKLKRRFKNWDELLNSPEREIAKAIKEGGLANIKAKRIRTVLRQIKEKTGKLDLDFLSDYSPADARNYLMQFDGIGPKSAAVIVAFAFGKPAFPIDTHIFRVIKRIPLIPEKMSYGKAHEFMEEAVPDKLKIPLHVQVIMLGRKICKAQKPLCSECVLNGMCKKIGVGKRG